MKHKEYALIVAGGRGTRMNSSTPKQFMLLDGLPVLMHTLKAFKKYSSEVNLVLVLPASEIEIWQSLVAKYKFELKHTIVAGGDSRFQSVKNGLDSIASTEGVVAIHDGVRPLVDANTIGASFRLAALHKCAVAAVRLKESIRQTDQDTTKAVDRSGYRLVQTPQTFDLEVIKNAYRIREEASLTDDASVAEKAGFKISLFEGSYDNIKITTPEDMIIAEALLNRKKQD